MQDINFLGMGGWITLGMILVSIVLTTIKRIDKDSLTYREDAPFTIGFGIMYAVVFIVMFSLCGKNLHHYYESSFADWEKIGYAVYVDEEKIDASGKSDYVVFPEAEWTLDEEAKELHITNP